MGMGKHSGYASHGGGQSRTGLDPSCIRTALSLSSYVAHCEELQPPALSVKYRLYTQ